MGNDVLICVTISHPKVSDNDVLICVTICHPSQVMHALPRAHHGFQEVMSLRTVSEHASGEQRDVTNDMLEE